MICPHCKKAIHVKELLDVSKIKLNNTDASAKPLLCQKCNLQIYLKFSSAKVLIGTFIALFGLSRIGLLQMKYHFVLGPYIFLSVLCIAFVAMEISPKPNIIEIEKYSKLLLLNFVFKVFLITMSGYLFTAIYLNIAPDRNNLAEIYGTVKSINIQNGMFNYIELNSDPYNLKYMIQDRFDSKAAHLQKDSKIRLYVEKYPSITGDSYRVWEIKSDNNEVLLPYEDLKITRRFAGSHEYTPIIKLLAIALLGYFVTRRFSRNAENIITESNIEAATTDKAVRDKPNIAGRYLNVRRLFTLKRALIVATILVIALNINFRHVSDREAVKIAFDFLTKAGIQLSTTPHVEKLNKPDMPFYFEILDFVLQNIVFRHNDGKKVIVGEELKEDHYLAISDSREVAYYSNRKIEKEVFKKYNISPDNRKPRNWPTLLTENKAKELAVFYANKIGLPKDVEFSHMFLNLAYNGTWDATWIRKLNGYPYEGDSCNISIMAIDGELHSYNKRFTGKPCPTVVKVTKEDAIEKGWKKISSYVNTENIKNEFDITSSELKIIQPNVFLGMVISNVFWKSKSSRLAWVINYKMRSEQTLEQNEQKRMQFHYHDHFTIYIDAASKKFLGGQTGMSR